MPKTSSSALLRASWSVSALPLPPEEEVELLEELELELELKVGVGVGNPELLKPELLVDVREDEEVEDVKEEDPKLLEVVVEEVNPPLVEVDEREDELPEDELEEEEDELSFEFGSKLMFSPQPLELPAVRQATISKNLLSKRYRSDLPVFSPFEVGVWQDSSEFSASGILVNFDLFDIGLGSTK